MNANFEKLIMRNGSYSLPYLIYIKGSSSKGDIELYFVNNNEDVVFEGKTYKASAFKYSPSKSEYGFTGGGSLSLSCAEERILELVESSSSLELIVKAVIDDENNINELKTFTHSFGRASVKKEQIDFSFDADDRLQMTFPTLVWSAQNNRGNS